MELNSDILYLLATGFSLLSIVAVFVIRYWFSDRERESDDKDDQQNNHRLVKGSFGELPVNEWKQHKLALEREYQDRIMNSSKSTKDDETPLIPDDDDTKDDDAEMDEAKAPASKLVRFNDTIDEKRLSVESDGKSPSALEEDVDEVLKEKLDEDDLAHLPGQLKSVKLRKATEELEAGLTKEEKEEEVKVRNQQLEMILNLMRDQQEKFGTSSMEDIEEQLKLYNF